MASSPASMVSTGAAVLAAAQHDFQAAGGERVVAEEFGRLQLRDQFGGQRRRRRRTCPQRARFRAAASIAASKPAMSTDSAALARDVGGQVDRETVGVVQAESIGARNHALGARGDVFEDAHARIQRLGEALFLGLQRTLDQVLRLAASSG